MRHIKLHHAASINTLQLQCNSERAHWLSSKPKITSAIETSQKKTVAAGARYERLVQFVVSNHGALIAAYNSGDSAVFKITNVTSGSPESWHTVISTEVGPRGSDV